VKDKDNPEQWKADWVSTFRTDIWQKRFIEDFNEGAEKIKLAYSAEAAEFTAIIKITDIDPGIFAGPMSNPTKLTGNISIVKTGDKETIATLTFKGYPENPYEMTPVDEKRVGAAFSQLGEMLGKIFAKKLK